MARLLKYAWKSFEFFFHKNSIGNTMLVIKWIGQSSDSLQMPSHATRLSLFKKKSMKLI